MPNSPNSPNVPTSAPTLAERAREAHAAAVRAARVHAEQETLDYYTYGVEHLTTLLAERLGVQITEDDVVEWASDDGVVASVEGMLFRWTEQERDEDFSSRQILSLLRRCVKCDQVSVPVEVSSLAGLGAELASEAPRAHRWPCTAPSLALGGAEEPEPVDVVDPAVRLVVALQAVLDDAIQTGIQRALKEIGHA